MFTLRTVIASTIFIAASLVMPMHVQAFGSTPRLIDSASIVKTGPATVAPGGFLTYTLTVTRASPAVDVSISDTFPAGLVFNPGLSSPGCGVSGVNVVCSWPHTLAYFLAQTEVKNFTLTFNVPMSGTACVLTNNAIVTTIPRAMFGGGRLSSNTIIIYDSVPTNNLGTATTTLTNCSSSSSSTTSSSSSTPPQGCIRIFKETYNVQGQPISTVAQFTFQLDGGATALNDANGNAQFAPVTPGVHTVSEFVPSGWMQLNVTPAAGVVVVAPGPDCAGVVFKNQQTIPGGPPPSSSSSSVSSLPPSSIGCIRVVKETYNAQNQLITPVIPFTFQLDGGPLVQNDAAGIANFANVAAPGVHTVTEAPLPGWTQTSVNPAGGVVMVNPGPQCPTVTFTNRMNAVSSSSSSSSSVPQGQTGCIEIVKETYNAQGQLVTPVIPFTFTLDGGPVTQNAANGQAGFVNVGAPGVHTIVESPVAGWTQISVSPAGGVVTVNPGAQCTRVTFKNQQNPPPSSSSSSSVPPQGQIGCIEIVKETYDAQNQLITPVIPFTFQLDGGPTTQNTSAGTAGFVNVGAPGIHTVTEVLPFGWTQTSVSPAGGVVMVNPGGQCARVTFTNRQTAVSSSSSSVPATGCISILKETYNTLGQPITPVAQFTYQLDGGPITYSDANGNAQFTMVTAPGFHTVLEVVPPGWTQINVTPPGGVVMVNPGSQCSAVVFKNQQNVPAASSSSAPSSSSSSSVSPQGQVGCIEIVKITNNPNAQPITPVIPFTFTLDGNPGLSVTNNASGNAVLQNVAAPGIHTVTETAIAGWTQTSIVPTNGEVMVNPGSPCAKITFTNQQNAPVSSSSSSVASAGLGCIRIQKTAGVTPVPAFTFTLDGNPSISAVNDSSGVAIIQNVAAPGMHHVDELSLSGWSQTSVTPSNGDVMVNPGAQCAVVNFVNAQGPASSSSSSSSSSSIGLGCIDVLKETYDTQGNPLPLTAQFTFHLDNGPSATNTSNGQARFNGVALGMHTITEDLPPSWVSLSVTPVNGQVSVTSTTQCATVVFKNQQSLAAFAGSSSSVNPFWTSGLSLQFWQLFYQSLHP